MSPRLFWCVFALFWAAAPARANRDLIVTVNIRKKCAQFDARSSRATRQTVSVLELSHEGSEITALRFEGQIRKLFVTHLGTMGRIHETIHLESGQPIWARQIRTTYDAPLSGRVVEREEDNLYFQNGRLIQRDRLPTMRTDRGAYERANLIHQTYIASPAQAREWKIIAREWQEKVARYQRALATKP